MTLKGNFWRGGGFNLKNLPWEGYGYFEQHNVWETWMILTHKRLLVDIFLTERLSKAITFCEFVSVKP